MFNGFMIKRLNAITAHDLCTLLEGKVLASQYLFVTTKQASVSRQRKSDLEV